MKQKRLLALLLALCLVLGLTACGAKTDSAAAASAAEAPASEAAAAPAEAPAPAEPAAQEPEAAEASAAEEPGSTVEAEPEIDCDEVFVVVHTNDVHGFIDVEPYVKAVADQYKAQYGRRTSSRFLPATCSQAATRWRICTTARRSRPSWTPRATI